MRTYRPAMIAAALLMAAACGGDGTGSADVETPEQPTTAVASGGQPEASDVGENYAVVTIGGTTFEVPADPLNLCNSLDSLIFGSFATDSNGNTTQAGGTEVAVQINFGLPVTDWEAQGLQPPTLNVDVMEEGTRWFASVELGAGSVDSVMLNDGMATGAATFVSQDMGTGEETGTEQGTFEVVCR